MNKFIYQKNRKYLKINLLLVFSLLISLFGYKAQASGASLYISPASDAVFVGSTFDVSILLNSGGNNINTVRVDLKFDPKKIQIASPTAGKSFISVWVSQPTYSNIEGTASFRGGIPSPGINTSAGLVSTITFRAVAPGETTISIMDSSQVLLDDGKGTNVLSSVSRGVYSIDIPPPEGPKVFSPTHPDQNKWYKNNSPNFSWNKEEGVTDFSYTLDRDFHGIPDNISEGNHTSVSYVDLEDGVWYFHIKAKKGDSWGGTSHYLVQIDTTPPADFKLRFEPTPRSPVITSKEPVVYFITTDGLSGISHYELKVVSLQQSLKSEENTFFVEINSPYKLPSLESGEYEIIVKAYDRAFNSRDVSEKIEVIPIENFIYITKKGINIGNLFLYWNKVVLVMIILVFLTLSIILYWKKRHNKIYKRKEILKRIKEKTEKNSREIKNKLHEE